MNYVVLFLLFIALGIAISLGRALENISYELRGLTKAISSHAERIHEANEALNNLSKEIWRSGVGKKMYKTDPPEY
jgi:hypothetical protein